MKKLLLSIMIASMLLIPMGHTVLADDETAAPVVEQTHNEAYIPGEAPAQSCAESIAPAMHAVLLAMGSQGVTSLNVGNDALSWEMLYNLLSMYGQMDDRSDYDGEVLVLPSETVSDYAAALFAAPLSPESMPEELADRMTYDAESDCYRLYCGSDALSEVRITAAEALDNSLHISGKLVFLAEEMELASFTATLVMADNLFGCTLTGLEVL